MAGQGKGLPLLNLVWFIQQVMGEEKPEIAFPVIGKQKQMVGSTLFTLPYILNDYSSTLEQWDGPTVAQCSNISYTMDLFGAKSAPSISCRHSSVQCMSDEHYRIKTRPNELMLLVGDSSTTPNFKPNKDTQLTFLLLKPAHTLSQTKLFASWSPFHRSICQEELNRSSLDL